MNRQNGTLLWPWISAPPRSRPSCHSEKTWGASLSLPSWLSHANRILSSSGHFSHSVNRAIGTAPLGFTVTLRRAISPSSSPFASPTTFVHAQEDSTKVSTDACNSLPARQNRARMPVTRTHHARHQASLSFRRVGETRTWARQRCYRGDANARHNEHN